MTLQNSEKEINPALAEIIKMMNIDEWDRSSHYPLIYAVKKGQDPFVRLLLENGIDAQVKDPLLGYTALHWAARENNEGAARILLEFGVPVDIRTGGEESQTPLMMAENENMIRLLLSFGADINASDNNGRTALYHYLYSGTLFENNDRSHDNIRLLLDAGANLHIKSRWGKNILHYALDDTYRGGANNVYKLTKLLIDYGADVNKGATDPRYFPLMLAIETADVEIVKLLLESGADIKVGVEPGQNALDYARSFENQEIIRLFRSIIMRYQEYASTFSSGSPL